MTMLKRFWCWLRDHPYPCESDPERYQNWLDGNEPFAPEVYCTNCGARIKKSRRTHS